MIGGSPTIADNLVSGNTVGGGQSSIGGGGIRTSGGAVIIAGNTICRNTATSSGWGYGGGIYDDSASSGDSATTIANNVVCGNAVVAPLGGLGGGLYFSGSVHNVHVSNCTMSGNTASTGGGICGSGIYNGSGCIR